MSSSSGPRDTNNTSNSGVPKPQGKPAVYTTTKTPSEGFVRSLFTKTRNYWQLTKPRLSTLVLFSTGIGYKLATDKPWKECWPEFLITCGGTYLSIASAQTFNQLYELESDSKMMRTENRLLPRGVISIPNAVTFGVLTGVAGPALLYWKTDLTTSLLTVANIVLYAGVYTPLKTMTMWNTWVGSFVGAIPPLIGWSAATKGEISPAAWVLAGLLYVWQLPHFLALSWQLTDDYRAGGYRMMSLVAPKQLPLTLFAHTAPLLAFGYLVPRTGLAASRVITVQNYRIPLFTLLYTPLAGYFTHSAYKFWRQPTVAQARRVFLWSIAFLPISLGLACI